MSKRTQTDSKDTNPREFWPTPLAAAKPLGEFLPKGTKFIEPCAGAGDLIEHLEGFGHECVEASDSDPQFANPPFVELRDARLTAVGYAEVITNPPFSQPLLKPLMEYWVGRTSMWLLLPSDMLINKWFNQYAVYVDQIIPIGRVSWLGNGQGGYENFVWAHFTTDPQFFITERA